MTRISIEKWRANTFSEALRNVIACVERALDNATSELDREFYKGRLIALYFANEQLGALLANAEEQAPLPAVFRTHPNRKKHIEVMP